MAGSGGRLNGVAFGDFMHRAAGKWASGD